MMKAMNSEINKIVEQVKAAQNRLQALLQNADLFEEARKYAEKQSKEVKKLFSADISKVKAFVEKERKELERFQKEIPAEVKKIGDFVKAQRKELEKLLTKLGKQAATKKGKKKAPRKVAARKPRKAATTS